MARPLRLEFAGALYHVTSRGNRREMIYESEAKEAKEAKGSGVKKQRGQVLKC